MHLKFPGNKDPAICAWKAKHAVETKLFQRELFTYFNCCSIMKDRYCLDLNLNIYMQYIYIDGKRAYTNDS